ncbi:RNA polymerase sigma-70 factor, ECF subfamily [Fodinibius roseus]|uniref:RNA polymerase sigma-70 factor, ECF subfamily n=1 Tax=Fodinibius roseus TaxID=1194090 RepID=A0A1M5JLJ0_9BACT|nr:RNA polymerase sigma-70 factor [Fodinibius roseus]SHG41255.1 RNA polymerase sigma-70 factor, ECF subfamily [Fodinibius roseus]
MIDPEQSVKRNSDTSPPTSEKEWVRRVREAGDRSAFEQIFRAYYKRLHGYAYSFVSQKQEAEDIVQTIFLNIWAQREDWDPPGTLKHYLFAAIRNEALNRLRHQQVVQKTEDEVSRIFRELKESSVSEEDDELRELRKDIQRGINQLPPRRRKIFVLNRRSGLTYAEIADFLDISVNTVGTQMGRALKSLREHLSDYLHVLPVVVELTPLLLYLKKL